MRISEQFAQFVVNTKIVDIPEETIIYTKELLLKTVAGMLAGTKTPACQKLVKYVKNQPYNEEASVLGCGFKTSIEYAAFINGLTSHASELEDDQMPSVTSDITIFPVILALAEKLNMTGKELLEASIPAFEIMNRMGAVPFLASRGITDLVFYGILGSAAVAAKAFSLNEDEVQSALGIAIGRASGFLVNLGSEAHYLESAFACKDGITAATLAKHGMTGNANIEEWLTTFFDRRALDLDSITRNLGKSPWHIHNIWIKKYPCCVLTHRQIDILLSLREKHKITPEDVSSIEIVVGPIDITCNRPNPKNIEDAKFSYQHVLASAMLEGDIGLDTFTEKKIADPRYKEFGDKIKVKLNENWPAEFNSGIANVNVQLNNGERISGEMEQTIGGPKSPLSLEQFYGLYKKYTRGILTEEKQAETADMIMNLEKYSDLKGLFETLTFKTI